LRAASLELYEESMLEADLKLHQLKGGAWGTLEETAVVEFENRPT
jgi:hypothetical protein